MNNILALLILPFALVLVILGFIGIMGNMLIEIIIDFLQRRSEDSPRCRQAEYKGVIKMENKEIKISTPNKPTHVTVSTPNEPTRVKLEGAFHSNSKCPSCDCGICTTFPTYNEVLCGSEETKDCVWLNYDFSKYQYGAEQNANQ